MVHPRSNKRWPAICQSIRNWMKHIARVVFGEEGLDKSFILNQHFSKTTLHSADFCQIELQCLHNTWEWLPLIGHFNFWSCQKKTNTADFIILRLKVVKSEAFVIARSISVKVSLVKYPAIVRRGPTVIDKKRGKNWKNVFAVVWNHSATLKIMWKKGRKTVSAFVSTHAAIGYFSKK